jgi:hypothetical protein
MPIRLIHYIIIIAFSGSCTTNHVKDEKPFLMIMPDTTKAPGKALNEWRTKANDKFNLPIIHHGVDSFELRIWLTSKALNLASPDAVKILKYSNSKWELSFIGLYSGLVEDSSQHEVTNKLFIEQKDPSYNLLGIIDKVDQMKLKDIPTQDDLPNFVDNTTNGNYYTIELATNKYYKLLRYHNPELFPIDSNCNKINLFIKFFYDNL